MKASGQPVVLGHVKVLEGRLFVHPVFLTGRPDSLRVNKFWSKLCDHVAVFTHAWNVGQSNDCSGHRYEPSKEYPARGLLGHHHYEISGLVSTLTDRPSAVWAGLSSKRNYRVSTPFIDRIRYNTKNVACFFRRPDVTTYMKYSLRYKRLSPNLMRWWKTC